MREAELINFAVGEKKKVTKEVLRALLKIHHSNTLKIIMYEIECETKEEVEGKR